LAGAFLAATFFAGTFFAGTSPRSSSIHVGA
jgi:hypothetical protein